LDETRVPIPRPWNGGVGLYHSFINLPIICHLLSILKRTLSILLRSQGDFLHNPSVSLKVSR
jgi:hypothetical protein